MIVTGGLHDHIHLREWHVGADAVNQRAKGLTRVVKGQSRAVFKALMASQQGGGDEASHVFPFCDIYPYVQGFFGQHRNDLEIRWCASFTCHSRDPFCSRHLFLLVRFPLSHRWWVEKRDAVGVPLPTSDQKYGFNLLLGVRPRPPACSQESSSKVYPRFSSVFPVESYSTVPLHLQSYQNLNINSRFCPKCTWTEQRVTTPLSTNFMRKMWITLCRTGFCGGYAVDRWWKIL